ncbi:MAG: YggU family protein [Rhodocyclaceae bacterium]|nr:YggU family protein [Rhodocyclaceae bacterium]MCB1899253.1 YggU family protein [Rhodocyclaceae bacterium]MCP5308278.1 YggU family protein [Zoogloeaceae bacterium]
MGDWLVQRTDTEWVLSLYIQPNAKKTEFCGLHGGAMKVRLAAPPVDGKANSALLSFIARFCGVGRNRVELISGETSRSKRVALREPGAEALRRLQVLPG